MPLFPRGIVSFGTVIATLLATMGDSAFVLISVMPKQWLLVSVFSFIVAVIVGYLVDLTPLGDWLLEKYHKTRQKKVSADRAHDELDHSLFASETGIAHDDWAHIGHEEGDEIDLALHHSTKGHQDV